MITPLLVDDQHTHGLTQARSEAARANGHQASGHQSTVHVETPAEALDALSRRAPGDAVEWFTHYLRRRDRALAELAAEEFGSVLETLATDFRREAAAEPTRPHATGLVMAAAVVSDTAAAFASVDQTVS